MFLKSFLYKRLISTKENARQLENRVFIAPCHPKAPQVLPKQTVYLALCSITLVSPQVPASVDTLTDMCSASQSGSQGVLAPAHSCYRWCLHDFQSWNPSSRADMTNGHKLGGSKTAKINFLLGQVSRSPKSRSLWGQFLWEVLRDNCSLVLSKVCVVARQSRYPLTWGHLSSLCSNPHRSFSVSHCILSHFLKKFSWHFHPIKIWHLDPYFNSTLKDFLNNTLFGDCW